MSASLAIAINVIADLALLGGLAYVMSRATRLKPHFAVARADARRALVAQTAISRAAPHGPARPAARAGAVLAARS